MSYGRVKRGLRVDVRVQITECTLPRFWSSRGDLSAYLYWVNDIVTMHSRPQGRRFYALKG